MAKREPQDYELALMMMCWSAVAQMYKENPVYSMAMSRREILDTHAMAYTNAITHLLVGIPYAVVEMTFEQEMAVLKAAIDGKKK